MDVVILENGEQKTVEGIRIPKEGYVPKKPDLDCFPGKTGVADAFQAAENRGLRVLYAPEFGLTRIENSRFLIWDHWYFTASSVMTGYSKQGNAVVAFAHIPTVLSNHEYIRDAVTGEKLVNGASPVSKDEFFRVLDQEGNGVNVVDYNTLKEAGLGYTYLSFREALEHPLPGPFLDADEDTVRLYLKRCRTDVIAHRYNAEDLPNKGDDPRGRLLAFGWNESSLCASSDLNRQGRVFGVREMRSVSELATDSQVEVRDVPEVSYHENHLDLDSLLERIKPAVAPAMWSDVEGVIRQYDAAKYSVAGEE